MYALSMLTLGGSRSTCWLSLLTHPEAHRHPEGEWLEWWGLLDGLYSEVYVECTLPTSQAFHALPVGRG